MNGGNEYNRLLINIIFNSTMYMFSLFFLQQCCMHLIDYLILGTPDIVIGIPVYNLHVIGLMMNIHVHAQSYNLARLYICIQKLVSSDMFCKFTHNIVKHYM